jgi:hypothetical protein
MQGGRSADSEYMKMLVREGFTRTLEVSQNCFIRERFGRTEKIRHDASKRNSGLRGQPIIRGERFNVIFQ